MAKQFLQAAKLLQNLALAKSLQQLFNLHATQVLWHGHEGRAARDPGTGDVQYGDGE